MVEATTGEIKLKDSLNNDNLKPNSYEVSIFETQLLLLGLFFPLN